MKYITLIKTGNESEITEWLTLLHKKNYILQQVLRYVQMEDANPTTYFCKALFLVEEKDKACANNDPDDMCNHCDCWKHTRAMCS